MAPAAVVIGGTGAVGAALLHTLATSGRWGTVTAIGRRAPPPADEPAAAAVRHVKLDSLDDLGGPEAAAAMAGADAVFCTLGTTRGVAGSAEAFKKVDLVYVTAAAEAAKKAGAKYFGLCSAQGANPNVWASDLAIFHPLLYMQTKGKAEEAVKAQGFEAAGIFRPGLLERGDRARAVERWGLKLGTSVAAADVAKVMAADAERFLAEGAPKGARTYEMAAIKRAAAAGAPPEP